MRRLTGTEMELLVALARRGRRGPAQALESLWDVILREAEGIGVVEAASRPGGFGVQDYAIDAAQAQTLLAAMTQRRRLPERVVAGFWLLWANQSPAEYGDRLPPATA